MQEIRLHDLSVSDLCFRVADGPRVVVAFQKFKTLVLVGLGRFWNLKTMFFEMNICLSCFLVPLAVCDKSYLLV